jgi:hypothetical protein
VIIYTRTGPICDQFSARSHIGANRIIGASPLGSMKAFKHSSPAPLFLPPPYAPERRGRSSKDLGRMWESCSVHGSAPRDAAIPRGKRRVCAMTGKASRRSAPSNCSASNWSARTISRPRLRTCWVYRPTASARTLAWRCESSAHRAECMRRESCASVAQRRVAPTLPKI